MVKERNRRVVLIMQIFSKAYGKLLPI